MDLVKSLSHLQAAMDDPKTRQVLESLAPRLFPSSEKDAAHRGYPSSSKPAGAPVSEPAPKSAAALALPKSASNLGAAAGPSPAAGAKPAEAESVGPDQRVQAVVDKLKAGKPVPAKGFQQDPPDEVEFTSALPSRELRAFGQEDGEIGRFVVSPDASSLGRQQEGPVLCWFCYFQENKHPS